MGIPLDPPSVTLNKKHNLNPMERSASRNFISTQHEKMILPVHSFHIKGIIVLENQQH